MLIDLLPGTTNVVRFPIERRARPTIDMLRELAPDVREVLGVAEAFDLPMPAQEVRAQADADMAVRIAKLAFPSGWKMPDEAADALLAPAVTAAIVACRAADDASYRATVAQTKLIEAQQTGGFWLDPLESLADGLTIEAASLLVTAYLRAEQAEGVARALTFARRGEAWWPFVLRNEAEELFFGPQMVGAPR